MHSTKFKIIQNKLMNKNRLIKIDIVVNKMQKENTLETIIKTTLIGLFFGTFGTTLGGIIGVKLKRSSNKFLSFILSLASRSHDFNYMF